MLRSKRSGKAEEDSGGMEDFDPAGSGSRDSDLYEPDPSPDYGSRQPGSDRPADSGLHYSLLQGIGRVFITVGLLVLSFLGYQLWGTNAVTAQTQDVLRKELQEIAPSAAGRAAAPPKTGDGIATMQIPKIGVDSVIVEGVDDASLKKGPGHYPETAFPGEAGNVVVSGHRTTYGAPFYRLDELKTGDEILMKDASGTYKYKVTEKKIVLPTDLSVVVPSTDARLTLTTCHPRFSARQRLIIVAALEGDPR